MTGVIATIPRFQFSNAQGHPLANGMLFTYLAGTTTPAKTWQDQALTIENTNPVRLDARGECVLWLDPAKSYKFVLKNFLGVTQWTEDNVVGALASNRERPVETEVQVAADGQKAFTLKKLTYTPGIGSLKVYVDGFRLTGAEYVETARDTVTFKTGLRAGQEVLFETGSGVNSESGIDAATIPFVPTLGPSTNVQEKLRQFVSVKDYGAKGDGISDDAAALQMAMDSTSTAGGGALHFPPGVYLVGAALQVKNSVCFAGVRGSTEIRLKRGVSAQILLNPNQVADVPVDDLTLLDIVFNANADRTESFAQSAVAVNGVRRFTAIGCTFKGATGYGLAFQAKSDSPSSINGPQSDIWIEDCVIEDNGYNGTVNTYDGFDFKSVDRLFVKNCIARNNAQKGFNFRGYNVNADGLIAYGNGQQGIEVSAGGAYGATVNMSNIHAYDNKLEGVTVAISGGVPGQRARVAMSNVQSHNNTRSGVRVYENSSFPLYGEFEVIVNGAMCWGNTEYGFANSSALSKAITVSGLIAISNTKSGIYNNGGNCTFTGAVSSGNGEYGYDGNAAGASNQVIGGNLSGNTAGVARNAGLVSFIGVEGVAALHVAQVANAVNYMSIEGRVTGGGPRMCPKGADANIELSLSTKGSGAHRFFSDEFGAEQFRITRTAGATSFAQASASTSNAPGASVGGAAADIDYSITPKGAGLLRYGAATAAVDTASTHRLPIKAANGTTYYLLLTTVAP